MINIYGGFKMKKKFNEENSPKTIFGVIGRYVSEIPFVNKLDFNRLLTQNTIEDLLFSNLLYTMDISVPISGCKHIFSEIFKTVTKTLRWNRLRYSLSADLPYTKEDFQLDYDVNNDYATLNNVHVTFYKNRPIFLITPLPDYSEDSRSKIKLLATIRTKDAEEFLTEFIAKSCDIERKYNRTHFKRTIDSIVPEGENSYSHISSPTRGNYSRSFNDVFIENEVLDKIKLGIESFISKKNGIVNIIFHTITELCFTVNQVLVKVQLPRQSLKNMT